MKRAAALTLGAVFFFGSATAFAQDKIDIGAAWVQKSGATKQLFDAMKTRLAATAPNISIDAQPELATIDELAAASTKFQTEKKAQILLRDSAASWLAKNKPSIPTFVGGVNNIAYYGTVDSMEKPGGNITGVSYYTPMETVLQSFFEILPDSKALTLITRKGHPGSAIDEGEMRKSCDKMKLTCNIVSVDNAAAAVDLIKSGGAKGDFIVQGNQGDLIDATPAMVDAAGKTPLLALNESAVTKGALAGLVVNLNELGTMLADTIVEVMVKGKPAGSIPVKVDTTPVLMLNMKTAAALGVQVPLNILAAAKVIE